MYDFINEEFDNPIKSAAVGSLSGLQHKMQKQRTKNQTLTSNSGKTMSYTLLHYVPGLSTFCGIRGTTVITGFMSGCYLFRYRRHGELRAAHIGTHDTNQAWSKQAKDVWKSYVTRPHISDVFGFDPARDVSDQLLADAAKLGTPRIIGLWEGNGNARVGVFATPAQRPTKAILVGIEHARLRPWSSIKNDPKMR
ncbi:hypothetical protein [Thermomonas sp. LB-4]|uniref:hypothetical protein n=1 Tax=Thermomonas sp. LB-4 TaxID=3102790 RepID=UPI002EDA2CCF